MKIVQGDQLDWVRGLEHRGGTFHYRNLMEGTPGTIDNFQQAIMMDSSHYDWVASSGNPGLHEKLLGVFTERRAQAGLFKLAPGATLKGSGRGIYFACSGQGRVGNEPLRAFTTVFLERGDE